MDKTPKVSGLIPKLLSNDPEGVFCLKSFLSMNQKKPRLSKKSGVVVKKKQIAFNQKDAINTSVTTKMLENVNHEKLSLLVDNLRKISKEPVLSDSEQEREYLTTPLSVEISELKQKRESNKKKPQTSVCSPQGINKTKRAEVFFKDALARRYNKDAPKLQR